MSREAAPPANPPTEPTPVPDTGTVRRDPFARLRQATPARIGLGQTGDGLPTEAVLAFQAAHARARDAVHARADFDVIAAALAPIETILVESRAVDRATYLQRPDLGRQLAAVDQAALAARAGAPCDLAIVVGDGLSAHAVNTRAADLVKAIIAHLPEKTLIAPVVLARGARVALGDDIGEMLQAGLVAVVIGERPGLSVADSLGIYLTFAPRRGRRDSERNCISNIHGNGGLSAEAAARKVVWLIAQAQRLSLTGVDLKDDHDGDDHDGMEIIDGPSVDATIGLAATPANQSDR